MTHKTTPPNPRNALLEARRRAKLHITDFHTLSFDAGFMQGQMHGEITAYQRSAEKQSNALKSPPFNDNTDPTIGSDPTI